MVFPFYSINSVLKPAAVSVRSRGSLSGIEKCSTEEIGAARSVVGGFLLTSTFQGTIPLLRTPGVLIFVGYSIESKMRELLFIWR